MNQTCRNRLSAVGAFLVASLGAAMLQIAGRWIYAGVKSHEMTNHRRIDTAGVGLGGLLLFFLPIYLFRQREMLVSNPSYRNRRAAVFSGFTAAACVLMLICGEDAKRHNENKLNYITIMLANVALLSFLLLAMIGLACFRARTVAINRAHGTASQEEGDEALLTDRHTLTVQTAALASDSGENPFAHSGAIELFNTPPPATSSGRGRRATTPPLQNV